MWIRNTSRYPDSKVRELVEFATRDIDMTGVCVNVKNGELAGGAIKEARFALGGVAHKPWRNPQAEAALAGQTPSEATFARAADIVLRDAKGFGHNTFKIDLARRIVVRALSQAARGTPQSQSNKKIA